MFGFSCAVLLAATASGQFDFGPIANPDDQFRFMWGTDRWSSGVKVPPLYPEMVKTGLNTLISYMGADYIYDAAEDRPNVLSPKWHSDLRVYLDRCQTDGISVMAQYGIGRCESVRKKFPRVRKDGSANRGALDAANPQARAACSRCGAAAARTLGRHPAVVGVQVESEIRDGTHPSFTPEMTAAYRRHSGHDIPKEVMASPSKNGRQPPHWKTIPGFPADRVVDDDFPVLDFYVWTWRKGDGWHDWLTDVAKAATDEIGPNALSMYDPSLRTPPMWGCGGDVSVINNWTYVYPEPYNISYEISRQHSRAKPLRQDVWAMIQCISYRSHLAPKGDHPKDEPAWAAKFPKAQYPTTPPDLVREAMWAVFSRRVDGIGFFSWQSLFRREGKSDYGETCCAFPETRDVIEESFHTVGEPLGPLLRAVPERAPKLAVVESYASMILGSRITWDCGGKFEDYGTALTAANLAPVSLSEDDIRNLGIPDSVKVLVMSECDVLTRKCYERIAEFKRRGGMILADADLCPALKADAVLPPIERAFPATSSDHDEGNGSVVSTAEMRERSIKNAAARLKALVGPRVVPYADADKDDILAYVRSYRNADYVFAINDRRTYGDFVGAWRRVKERGLPNSGTVTVKRAVGAAYDLVRHCPVPFVSEDGNTRISLDFPTNGGRLILLSPRPLSPLSVSVDGQEVTVTSPDKDVMVPFSLDGVGDKPFYGAVADGKWKRTFAMVSSSVTVTSLADGKSM